MNFPLITLDYQLSHLFLKLERDVITGEGAITGL